jgi:hypothetical protein
MNPHHRYTGRRKEARNLVNRIRVRCGKRTVCDLNAAIRGYLANPQSMIKYNELKYISYKLLHNEYDLYRAFSQYLPLRNNNVSL